tara:strand:+ start:56 stop:367 length:312 start_codon:yes stop_codon:yes gene_type:complete
MQAINPKPFMITIELAEPRRMGNFLIVSNDESIPLEDRGILIQTDGDYPGIASTFGWLACECGETDGTVDCSHRMADEMIGEAFEFLLDHEGETVEDPGYFGG